MEQIQRHIGGDVRQRSFARAASAHGLLDRRAHLDVERGSHQFGGRNGAPVEHLDRGRSAGTDNVLHQACQTGGLGLHLRLLRRARTRRNFWEGASPHDPDNQAFGHQLLHGMAHGHPAHAELTRQLHLSRHALGEASFLELLTQHQINLVVFGQRQSGRHAITSSQTQS